MPDDYSDYPRDRRENEKSDKKPLIKEKTTASADLGYYEQ